MLKFELDYDILNSILAESFVEPSGLACELPFFEGAPLIAQDDLMSSQAYTDDRLSISKAQKFDTALSQLQRKRKRPYIRKFKETDKLSSTMPLIWEPLQYPLPKHLSADVESDLTELIRIMLEDNQVASISAEAPVAENVIKTSLKKSKRRLSGSKPLAKINSSRRIAKGTKRTDKKLAKDQEQAKFKSKKEVSSDLSLSRAQIDNKEDSKRRRTKWLEEDTKILWEGIMKYGNNWSEIKALLPGRTYYQVKDKGRRLLHRRGWRTGRSKNDASGASANARNIAKTMLTPTPSKRQEASMLAKRRATSKKPKVQEQANAIIGPQRELSL